MSGDRFWLGVLIVAAVIFLYTVTLPGDDGESSVGSSPAPTSSRSDRRRCYSSCRRSDIDRWSERAHAEIEHLEARGKQ